MKNPNIFKRAITAIRNIPHLFAKLTVIFCLAFVAGCSIYALRIEATTAKEPASLLGVIIGFFGTELCMMCLKTIFDRKKSKKDKDESSDSSTETSDDDTPYTNF